MKTALVAEVLRKHQHNYCEECRVSYGCTCGWSHGEEVGDCRPDDDSALRSISAHQTEVLAALDGAPEPEPTDALAIVEEVLAIHADRIGTHYEDCYKYHVACLAVAVKRRLEGEGK